MGKIQVKITGLNLNRLIQKLISNGVMVENVEYKSKQIKFFINEKNLNLLKKICKEERKIYTVIQKNFFKKLLYRIPYLFGSFFASLLIFIYMFSFCSFVNEIEIIGTNLNSTLIAETRNVLNNNNIFVGTNRDNVDSQKIETKLMEEICDISSASVKLYGGKLVIKLFPRTQQFEIKNDNIISKYNAVVTQAQAHSGNLKVKEGDVVKVGDVLIENCDGASGIVKGNVYFSSYEIYNENQNIEVKTGRVFEINEISVFDLVVLKSKNTSKFQSYIEEKCVFYINDDLFIPVKCTKKLLYETTIEKVTVPFEERQDEIFQNLYNKTLALIPSGNDAGRSSYSVVSDGSFTRIDCFIEVEINLF
ncbi:MAG: sporulation protein YqfD [Clostridia bacterium]|nr:sporulation protein YqfD [Clostridia bacterium]